MDRLGRIGFWAALAGPVIVVLLLVLRYGVNVPYADEWVLVTPLARLATGKFHWMELFNQHNEHRIVFPRLAIMSLAQLTAWNIRAELLVSIALCIGSLALLMALMRPVLVGSSPLVRIWAALTTSILMFSLTQWENWLWGWQIQWFLAIFAVLASIALATWSLGQRFPWPYVAGSALAAFVSHYSLASGLLTWVVAGFILAFHERRRPILAVWALVAVAASVAYFVGYVRPPHHPSPADSLKHPVALVVYIANYVSGALGRHAVSGLLVGGAFLTLAAFLLWRSPRQRPLVLPWIAIGAFVGGNALVTGIGRVGLGAHQALDSRYASVAALIAVALVPLGILAFRTWPGREPLRTAVGTVAAVALTLAAATTSASSLRHWAAHNEAMVKGRNCLLAIDAAPDSCLLHLYPLPNVVRALARQLPTLGWGGLPESARPPKTLSLAVGGAAQVFDVAPEDGSVGVLDEAAIAEGTLVVRGWAQHPDSNLKQVRRVLVVGSDALLGIAEVTSERPDVAAFFGDPSLRTSGWVLRVPVAGLAPGPNRIRAFLEIGGSTIAPIGETRVVRSE